MKNKAETQKHQNWIVLSQMLLCFFGLTYGVLLADVSHYPHKTITDALFIRFLTHRYTSPVALFILPFLI